MTTITIHERQFVVNPKKISFFTGFQKSLGDIFMIPTMAVEKQLLYCNGHYTTYSRIHDGKRSFWTFWNKPVILYDDSRIYGDDQIYLLENKEVAIRAWLQSSKHYKGPTGGIFANEHNSDLVHTDSEIYKYMQWLDANDAYYLAYGSFVDGLPNYILK